MEKINEKKSVIRKCKELVNVKSDKYNQYKSKSRSKIAEITLLGFFNFFTPVILILTVFQPSQSSVKLAGGLLLITVIADLVVIQHIKKDKFFIQPSEYENDISESSSVRGIDINLVQVEEEMNKRKDYVRKSVKLIKWVFSILVISILEEQIRELLTPENLILGYVMTVLLGFIIISYPYIFGCIVGNCGKIINKFNFFIEYCIDNGVGVKNYELLNMSIEILKKEKMKSQS